MEAHILPLFGCLAGVFAFAWGFSAWRRARLIVDTQTARVRSMPLGCVELHGLARTRTQLVSPITNSPCVYYRYRVQRERGHGTKRRWETIETGDSASRSFYLEDDTGSVLVMPDGAEMNVARSFSEARGGLEGAVFGDGPPIDVSRWTGGDLGFLSGRLRLQEWRIHAGDPLYVLGVAQERPERVGEPLGRTAKQLAALRADPQAQAYLDRDGDGTVSDAEWEIARRIIENETGAETQRDTVNERLVVGADPSGEATFLVSNQGERAVVSSYRAAAFIAVFAGASLAVASLWALLDRLGFGLAQGG